MNRRFAISRIAVSLGLVPLSVAAQPGRRPPQVAVFTLHRIEGQIASLREAFLQGMRDLGYVENRNIAYRYFSAEGDAARLEVLAREIVALDPAVVLVGAPPAFLAIRRLTSTIPIVIPTLGDPVESGIVDSYSKPGGNVTGLSSFGADLTTKRLEILLELLPDLARLGVLWDATGEYRNLGATELRLPGRKPLLAVVSVGAKTTSEIEAGIAQLARDRVQAIAVAGGPVFNQNTRQIVELALQSGLPTMFGEREDIVAGGLMSYGQSLTDRYRRAAVFVDKIVRGTRPADLPIEQSSKIELVINLKTARALGLTVPQSLLLRADEIID